ncbi:MAG: hypothetical protein ABR992_19395, partial [Solirubrobacteraceae bacterium]
MKLRQDLSLSPGGFRSKAAQQLECDSCFLKPVDDLIDLTKTSVADPKHDFVPFVDDGARQHG